jgi:hypothetical protein
MAFKTRRLDFHTLSNLSSSKLELPFDISGQIMHQPETKHAREQKAKVR